MIFLIACLAVWRICTFIANEGGPGDFMFSLRGRIHNPDVREWFKCVKCNSVWVSMPVAAYLYASDHYILYWLAMSAVVMLLEVLYGMLWWKS